MKTLVDLFEMEGNVEPRKAPAPRPTIDLDVDWQTEEPATSPGAPSETWLRARGWSSDDGI